MTLKRIFKWLGMLGAAILLSLMARAALSAVEGIYLDPEAHNLSADVRQFFEGWRGSKSMIAAAVVCIVVAIVGKGIERH